MNLVSFNKYIITLLFIVLMNLEDLVYGSDQVLKIYSKSQIIDVLTNTICLKQDVLLIYKKIELYANEIVIVHSQNIRNVLNIKAYGDPLILFHNLELEYSFFVQSSIMHYNIIDNVIKFIGNVRIKQLGSFIQSDNIEYFVNQKKVRAISKETGKTIMVLQINSI